MIICHCKAVSDRSIRKAVRDGAMSLEDVGRACGAGSSCGACQDAVTALIHREAAHHSTSPTSIAPPSQIEV